MSVAKDLHFVENFGLSGAAAIISKTAAAPIERVKLLVQNQDEMIKAGRLDTPYKGVIDCTKRTYQAEGIVSFWRGESTVRCTLNATCKNNLFLQVAFNVHLNIRFRKSDIS